MKFRISYIFVNALNLHPSAPVSSYWMKSV